jgi:hypothetical protein
MQMEARTPRKNYASRAENGLAQHTPCRLPSLRQQHSISPGQFQFPAHKTDNPRPGVIFFRTNNRQTNGCALGASNQFGHLFERPTLNLDSRPFVLSDGDDSVTDMNILLRGRGEPGTMLDGGADAAVNLQPTSRL